MKFIDNLFAHDFVSEYSHSNYIDMIDGKQFLHMDCSGFANWVLAQTGHRRALVELRKFLRQNNFIKINRFFCKDFAIIYHNKDNFAYWEFLDKPVTDCIMIVVFPDGNGHCMFVNKILRDDGDKVCLRITDSTRYPHQNDTRAHGQSGIGMGDVNIQHKNDGWYYDSGNDALPVRRCDIYFVRAKQNI